MTFIKWIVYPTWAQVEYTEGKILRMPKDVTKEANYQELLKQFPKPVEPKHKARLKTVEI